MPLASSALARGGGVCRRARRGGWRSGRRGFPRVAVTEPWQKLEGFVWSRVAFTADASMKLSRGVSPTMPHISLPEGLPGILGPMAFRPETAKPLNELAEILLRRPSTLSPGERELIATYGSSRNCCFFCQTVHGAVAAYHLDGNEQLVLDVKQDAQAAPVSDKLKALLAISGKVQRGGTNVWRRISNGPESRAPRISKSTMRS